MIMNESAIYKGSTTTSHGDMSVDHPAKDRSSNKLAISHCSGKTSVVGIAAHWPYLYQHSVGINH